MTDTKTPKKAAIYIRVSTDKQTVENQLRELKRIAEFSGWEIVEVYEDHGVSGAKGKDKRPAFKRLCEDATGRKFNIIMAWSLDRLSRSMKDLVDFMEELKALNIDLYLKQQNIDTTSPAGRAFFHMMGVFAEFERAMIQERVNAGLARARAEGKTLGRPKLDGKIVDKIKADRAEGMSLRAIQRKHKVSLGSVHKVVRAA